MSDIRLTDPRDRANRAIGKAQSGLSTLTVNLLRAAIAREIADALKEAGVESPLQDLMVADTVQAHFEAIDALLSPQLDTETKMARSKGIIGPRYRTVGK